MAPSIIAKITKAGAIIMTTVASFILSPPALTVGENQGVNWKNFVTFFAGIMSIALYDQFKTKARRAYFFYLLLGILVVFMMSYEYLYLNYSKPCFGDRIIISHVIIKPDAADIFSYWQKHSQEPLAEMLRACQCDPTKMWNKTDLLVPYYSLIILYFAILVMVILLIVLSGDLYADKKLKPSN
jgi:Ca2+/Na+ antiporter